MNRDQVFARDGYRCVYCGQVRPADDLTVDHVQPRVRGGDRSKGNLVTACCACNALKGSRRLSVFLKENAAARQNFYLYATAVWARHLRALTDEMEQLDRRKDLGG
ncbi:MAG: HNH endonuclease [Gemmatimonadaceae bacterium]